MELGDARTNAETLRGETIFTPSGENIGDVETVLYDKATGQPEWLAVRSGLFGVRSRIVPFHGAARSRDGITVPYDASKIQAAPELEGNEISQGLERQLAAHYGLAYSESRSPTGLAQGKRKTAQQKPRNGGRQSRKTASAQRRQSGRSSSRGSLDRTPTRDELYEDAKRLGIEGRSKMNKAQLQRAVDRQKGRSSSGGQRQANPFEVQAFLEAVGYPAAKRELVREAKEQGANARVRSTLERLPDKEFGSPAEVSEAIGSTA